MRRSRHSGFSLPELLMSVAIFAVVTAIAVPSMTTLRNQGVLVSLQREVLTALYLARSGAIASNSKRQVIFTPPKTITIKDQAGTTTYYTRDLSTYGSAPISGTGAITVPYDARGLLNPPTAVTITVTNSKQSKTIMVYPSGKAAVG